MNLRIPGPTPLPPSVMQACNRQMIGLRDPEFINLYNDVEIKLQNVFQTKNDVLIFAGTGTGGLEAAVVNLISPGDRVFIPYCGAFGKRWASIAKAFGADVTELEFPSGQPIDVEIVIGILKKTPTYKFLLITHNETSTGITNDLRSLSEGLASLGGDRPLVVVDAVSSLGAIDLPMDRFGIDVIVTASQKALMSPPGLTFVSLSPSAWNIVATSKSPRYYWDFRLAWDWNRRGGTPFTPSISLIYAVQAALNLILDEGLQNVYLRHEKLADKMRKGIIELGLELFVNREEYASNTVTSIYLPSNYSSEEFIYHMKDRFNVVIGGGMGNPIFRIAHMGYVNERDIDGVLHAINIMTR